MTSLHIQRVESLIAECEIREPPINIYQLILACERELHFSRLSEDHQGTCISFGPHLPDTVVLNRHPDRKWRRRRFTAAHELNHALFHDGYDATTSEKKTIKLLERDSNSFAALMLMPQSLLSYLDEAYGFLSIEMIANIFGVSITAAKYRLYAHRKIPHQDIEGHVHIERLEARRYQDFKYMEIPRKVEAWKIIQSIIHGPCMTPFCLRCGCLKLDEYPEVCWGCGKNTTLYIDDDRRPSVNVTAQELSIRNPLVRL